jgi:hypothetical protein
VRYMAMSVFPRLSVSTAERRRVFIVVMGLSCFLGMIAAALWQHPPPSTEGEKKRDASWRLLSAVRTSSAGANDARFRHILDDFGGDQAPAPDNGQPSAVDASTLSDLQNELRRLKRPLRVLIHQLEPPSVNTPVPTPPPARNDLDAAEASNGAGVVPALPDPPSPVMHRLVFHNKWPRERTVFVTIIGRVQQNNDVAPCARMIDALFEQAASPAQLRVGVVEVYHDHTNLSAISPFGGCVDPKFALCNQSAFCATDFLRVRRVLESQIGDDRWDALALATSMYRKEAYVLLLANPVVHSADVVLLPKRWDELYVNTLGQRSGGRGQRKALTSWLPRRSQQRADGGEALPSPSSAVEQPLSWFPCTVTSSTQQQQTAWNVALGDPLTASTESSTTTHAATIRTHLTSTDVLFAPGNLLVDVPMDPIIHQAPDNLFNLVFSLRLFAADYHSFAIGPALQPRCGADANHMGELCVVPLRSEADTSGTTSAYLNDILQRGWDEQDVNANQTAPLQPLNPRFSASRGAVKAFWDTLGGDARTQCSRA